MTQKVAFAWQLVLSVIRVFLPPHAQTWFDWFDHHRLRYLVRLLLRSLRSVFLDRAYPHYDYCSHWRGFHTILFGCYYAPRSSTEHNSTPTHGLISMIIVIVVTAFRAAFRFYIITRIVV